MHSQLRCQNSLPLNEWVHSWNIELKLFRIFSNPYPVDGTANNVISFCVPQSAFEWDNVNFYFTFSSPLSRYQTAIFRQLISPSESIFDTKYCCKCEVIEMEIVEVVMIDENCWLFHSNCQVKCIVIQFSKLPAENHNL